MIEYQFTIDKTKLTISTELVMDLSNHHGKDGTRKAIHDMVDDWLDGYLGEE